MTYRKTWFDYVLWIVYAGLCVTLLALVGNRLYDFYVGTSLAWLGAFLFFPVLICLYTGIRLASYAIRRKYRISDHFSAMTEALAVSVSFVFGTILRIREGFLMASAYETSSAYGPGDYYEMALVRAGEDNAVLAHGMSDLFVRCLRGVFSFLGNSVPAAMLFQAFLQMIALLFAYLAVRKAAGRFASCTTLLLMAFSGLFIWKMDKINAECLFIALFLAGLYLVISFVKSSLGGNCGLAGAVFVGLVLGLLCYLELGCVILILFLAGLFTGKMGTIGGRKRLVGLFFLVIAGCVAGFLGSVAVDASMSGAAFYQSLSGWMAPYLQPHAEARMLYGVVGWMYPLYICRLLLASFLVFTFIREGREQNFSLWFLPCILVTPALLFDFSVVGFGGLALFFWSVMAGLGLKGTVFGGQAELVREKIEEINAAISPVNVGAVPAATAPSTDISQGKPRFIENPLPLPKKHVKREMDYDYHVSEEDMHYDVEVADGDDFDR